MSQEIIDKALQRTLISPLTSDLLWSEFLTAHSYEIANMEDFYASIKDNWNIEHNTKENLIRIAETFGYTPNLIINSTISMAKRELESLPYRIREKTTYNGYSLIFQQNGLLGDTFNYYFDGKKLVKCVDYDATQKNLVTYDKYSPFYGVKAIKNFSTALNSPEISLDYMYNNQIIYDSELLRYYSLDQKFNPWWQLDTPYLQLPTKHLGIEYFPSKYYCSYTTSLGYAVDESDEYETNISMKEHYKDESIKVLIDDLQLDITITTEGNFEYIEDSYGVLNPMSYYDKENGTVHLIFDIIPTDCEIAVSYDINLFYSSDYFYYLEQGMEYNRRCPIIPHTGVFLSAEVAQARGTDFYHPNENGYTIEDLKLKVMTATSYNKYIQVTEESRLDNATDEYGVPNGEENYKLDDTIKWFLDTSSTQTEPIKQKFKYIACGNGALPMIDEKHAQIFNQKNILFGYNLNGDDNSNKVLDISSNTINCTIFGDTVKTQGCIGKSVNFNGETWVISDSTFNVDSTRNYTLALWFKADKQPSTSIEYIFDNFIDISYDYENEQLIIDSQSYDCSKDEPHFLCLDIRSSNNEINVYLDEQMIDTMSFTIIGTSHYIYIGNNSTLTEPFYGVIDTVWLLGKTISNSDIEYLYENKVNFVSHMGNRLSYYELSDGEIADDDKYTIVQSYVKAMDITNEEFNVTVDEKPNYELQTKFYPVKNPYFILKYYDHYGIEQELKANEKGQFFQKIKVGDNHYEYNKLITGHMDFENGQCTIAKDVIESISQKTIKEPQRTEYPNAYHKIDYTSSPPTDEWYSYIDPSTGEYDNIIIHDKMDLSTATDYEKISIYHEIDDNSNSDVYEYNDDGIYRLKDNSVLSKWYLASDSDETKLFSNNNGGTLYKRIDDLLANQNKLGCYIDLGEATNTTIYSTDGGSTVFLDVGCTSDKQVKKWNITVNGVKTYGYTVKSSSDESSIMYANLAFTSEITPDEGITPTHAEFNPMSIAFRLVSSEISVSLQELHEEYKHVYAINYFNQMEEILIYTAGVDLVKGSITFSYWITDSSGVLKKYTATVNEQGFVSGAEIRSGSFNYTTNRLNVLFDVKIESEVVCSFEYYSVLDVDITKPFIMNYKIEKSIIINEIGFEDENHELLAYMTFPNIEYHSIYNNISAMIAINKS